MPSVRTRLGSVNRTARTRAVRAGATPRAGRRVAALVALVLGAGLLLGSVTSGAGAQDDETGRTVLRTTVDGAITPVIADHVDDAIARAEDGGYEALVIELDTPGGLDTSMRDIIQNILEADVPVAVYVSPQGARAGSAGALIGLSAHVLGMAPGTAIGASTPVDLQGGEISDKVVNDAAAYAEAIAELRGRNTEVAVDMVRDGRSLPVTEALDEDVADLEVASLTELLDRMDGTAVEVGPDERRVVLATAGAAVDEFDMGLFRRIQQTLADPNIAFLLLSVGTLGIIYELASPGIGAGGVVGVTGVLLGLFALSVLPVNIVGLLLLLLSAAMFVVELFAPGIGVAAAGGTATLLLSGVFLFRDTPGLQVSMAVVAPVALVVGGSVVVAGRLVWRARRSRSRLTGEDLFVDRIATVTRSGSATPQALVEGAWWNVRSTGPELRDGATVRVVEVDGLDLLVEPVPDAPRPPADAPRPVHDAPTVPEPAAEPTDEPAEPATEPASEPTTEPATEPATKDRS